jgi:hypothetical protein
MLLCTALPCFALQVVFIGVYLLTSATAAASKAGRASLQEQEQGPLLRQSTPAKVACVHAGMNGAEGQELDGSGFGHEEDGGSTAITPTGSR